MDNGRRTFDWDMALPGIRCFLVASGFLGLHEENALLVAEIVLPFLDEAAL